MFQKDKIFLKYRKSFLKTPQLKSCFHFEKTHTFSGLLNHCGVVGIAKNLYWQAAAAAVADAGSSSYRWHSFRQQMVWTMQVKANSDGRWVGGARVPSINAFRIIPDRMESPVLFCSGSCPIR